MKILRLASMVFLLVVAANVSAQTKPGLNGLIFSFKKDFGNHLPKFIDHVVATCAGLWNFKIAIRNLAILY